MMIRKMCVLSFRCTCLQTAICMALIIGLSCILGADESTIPDREGCCPSRFLRESLRVLRVASLDGRAQDIAVQHALHILDSQYVQAAVDRSRPYFWKEANRQDREDTLIAVASLLLLESNCVKLSPEEIVLAIDKWGDIRNGYIRGSVNNLLMNCIIYCEKSGIAERFSSLLLSYLEDEVSPSVADAPFTHLSLKMVNDAEISDIRREYLIELCKKAKRLMMKRKSEPVAPPVLVTLARILARDKGSIVLSSWEGAFGCGNVARIPHAFSGHTQARTAMLWLAHHYPHDENHEWLIDYATQFFPKKSAAETKDGNLLGRYEAKLITAVQKFKECDGDVRCWLKSDLAFYSAFVPALHANGCKQEAKELASVLNSVFGQLERTFPRFDSNDFKLYWPEELQ